MVRFGEMMVVVRAQDFASRTIRKVSGELQGMSRQQAMLRRQMILGAKQMRVASNIDLAKSDLTNLRVIKDRMAAERQFQDLYSRRGKLRDIVKTGRIQGRFASKAEMNAAAAGAQKLSGEMRNLGVTMGTMDDTIARMPSRYGRMALAAKSTAAGLADLDAKYKAGIISARELGVQEKLLMEEMSLAAKQAALMPLRRLHDIGSAMSGVGRTMQLFGAVGTVAFGLAANSFAKFSQSAATAGTQMRDIGAPMAQAVARSKELQKAILDMSMVFPNSAQDMTDAAYEIFSSMNLMHNGIMNVNAGLKLLAVANKAAVAGGVDLKEATNAMIVALNIFDPKLQDVQGTMDEVFNIVRFGKIRLDDLSHVFTQFASAAHAGGMSLKEVGAAFATLTLFQDPGKASAGLGRLIELLRTPAFREGLDKLVGVKVIAPDTGKMKPLLAIFQQIVKARPELSASRKAAVDFFIELTKASGLTKAGIQGTVQARRAFETFATHMGTFSDTVHNVNKNYNEMDQAFKARMADPGVQWELLKNRLKALALVIGQQVLPVFLQIGEWITHGIRWFKSLNDGIKGTFLRFAAWAAVGTLLAGVLLSVGGSILQLAATMAVLTIATEGTSLAFIAMRAALITTGIGALIVAFGVAAYLVIKHWNAVRAFFQALGEELKSNWKSVMQQMAGITLKGIAAMFNPLYQLEKRIPVVGKFAKFLGPLNLATAGLEKAGQVLIDTASGTDKFWQRYHVLVKKFGKDSKQATDWLQDYKRIVGQFDNRKLSEPYKKWANATDKYTYTAAQRAKDHAQAVKQATENMQQTLKTATTNLINQYETLQQANQTALGGLFQGPTMQGILGNVFKTINDNLRQFGIQIPVPFKILKQDLQQSVTYFKRWRNDITKLTKRGVPYEMIQQLQAMGPEGIPILEGLLAAPKGQFKAIVKTYKEGQKLTDKATNEDMKRKLTYWNKFGKDAAYQTIMGIIQNPKNAKLQKMYETYVKDTYGSILQKTFQDDVNKYMATALENAKAQAAAAKIMPPIAQAPPLFASGKGKGGRTGGTGQLTVADLHFRSRIKRFNYLESLYARAATTSPYYRAKLAEAQQAEHNLRVQRRNVIQQERQNVRQQLIREQRMHPKWDYINVTYAGDTVTVHADGATPAAVTRAMQKLAYVHKHKHKKGTTAGGYSKWAGT